MKKLITPLFVFMLMLIQVTIVSATSNLAGNTALPTMVSGTIVETTDKTVTVNSSERAGNIVLNISNDSIIVDYVSGKSIALKDRTNDKVVAYYGPAVTASIPPQSNALIIVCNLTDDYTAPRYGKVEAIEKIPARPNLEQVKVTTNNGSMIFTITKDTPIVSHSNRNPITLSMIDVGSELLMWYSAITIDNPSQATAEKVLFIGTPVVKPEEPSNPSMTNPIKGVIVNSTDKTIEVKPNGGGENLILNLSDKTVMIDNDTGKSVALKDRKNDNITAYYGPAVTASIPPQSNAIVVMLNVPRNGVSPHYAVVESVQRNRNQIKVTVDNGSMVVTINNNIPILTYLTSSVITLDMIEAGTPLLMWYPLVATSIPAQATAEKIMYLGASPDVKYSTVIKLKIGSTEAYANNIKFTLDAPPMISNERTMLPIRFIAEVLGYDVGWNDSTKTVTLTSGSNTMTLQIGNNQATVNGVKIPLDAPPIISNERTMLPIRFIAEQFGAVVDWDDATRTVTIQK